jgi:hypothetical protein
MSNTNKKKSAPSSWIPEIMYEENSHIPFIDVPKGETDPVSLFISLVHKTDETEPDMEGNEIPVYDMRIEHYARMSCLSEKLSPEDYDKVRIALGLKPLVEAVKGGREIFNKVQENVTKIAELASKNRTNSNT